MDLWPAYCLAGAGCVLAWVITTPLRTVSWIFFGEVWRVLSPNPHLVDACIRHYQAVMENDDIRRLSGAKFAYAVWGAFFAVRVRVLSGNEERYGAYDRMICKWGEAAYGTFYSYLPDLTLSTAYSVIKYACAGREAVLARVHTPLVRYGLLGFFLLGKAGIAFAMVTLNGANHYWKWTIWGPPVSVAIVSIGVVKHIWRDRHKNGPLETYAPAVMVLDALKGVRARAAERQSSETDCLRRLHVSGVNDNEEYSDTHGDSDPHVEVEPTAPNRSPVAISAELRATEECSAELAANSPSTLFAENDER
ncbi:unnamed protein product [Phytophthora fragariaefolia]|uniref:Unnamed protein product n=1 Tax=Phytophthora fragariaefolia TaxID=1490495 RepID=A0A9W6YMU0_9STRA|nr:unnamed protein product [Phytophthora fragariaefolia]